MLIADPLKFIKGEPIKVHRSLNESFLVAKQTPHKEMWCKFHINLQITTLEDH